MFIPILGDFTATYKDNLAVLREFMTILEGFICIKGEVMRSNKELIFIQIEFFLLKRAVTPS